MLVNPHSDNQDETNDHEGQKQKYETMQCFAVSEPKSIKEEAEDFQSCLICVARRMPMKERPVLPTHESFTTRQDLQGNQSQHYDHTTCLALTNHSHRIMTKAVHQTVLKQSENNL
uniref:Uncharacterized protein n=1 Tax=Hucho hucho TaxID=62062 RepID=A0A4W5LKC1_9TELE